MRVPLSWLRDYVEFDLSIDEVAELLTNAGLEVESITRVGLPGAELEWDRERVVLGRVPIDGVVPLSPSADTVGWFGAAVEDVWEAAAVIVPDWRHEEREQGRKGEGEKGRRGGFFLPFTLSPFHPFSPAPLHHQNCSKKRKSLAQNWRMSSIPYLSMAIRSGPRPAAKPKYFIGS